MSGLKARVLGFIVSAGLVALCVGVAGCAHQQRLVGGEVQPVPNNDLAALNADDIVLMMRRAGFSDDEILKYGPRVRNDIAVSGGSRVATHSIVAAIFAVHGENVYVSTQRAGTFRYNYRTQTFR